MSAETVDSAQGLSDLEEIELKERISMLKDQERSLRSERHVLEARLRNMILARYAELSKRYGARTRRRAPVKRMT